jgi:glycosyltransferase involved in cell wall biosynthesis
MSNHKTRPWLSIIIPTYNGEKYLPLTLNSIKNQNTDNREIELVIVDDGSTDKTKSIIKNYSKTLPIKYYFRPHFGSWRKNTNFGLNNSHGTFACLLPQDDLWLDDKIKHLKLILNQAPDIDLIIHPIRFINSSGASLGHWHCPLPVYPKIVNPNDFINRLLIQNFIASPAPIFRRTLAIQNKGFDEKLWLTADWDFWLKIGKRSKIIYTPEILGCFRVHLQSQTIKNSYDIPGYRHQLEVVLNRYLSIPQSGLSRNQNYEKAARLSVDVNTAFVDFLHGNKFAPFKLLPKLLEVGPASLVCYFENSRIIERLFARYRLNFTDR